MPLKKLKVKDKLEHKCEIESHPICLIKSVEIAEIIFSWLLFSKTKAYKSIKKMQIN